MVNYTYFRYKGYYMKHKNKKCCIGILAHVDAGKTTLSESLLYVSGAIRRLGRVDNKDAYLDHNSQERNRGITIFSKQAMFEWKDVQFTLVDTPGHVDFSAEMERTLQILDYAVLVISGADGVQGHTQTLWRLLRLYQIPTFVFVNKMDQLGTNKERLLREIRHQLSDGCVEFDGKDSEAFYDSLAMCEETLMEQFLETGEIPHEEISRAVKERTVFPCYFGSALKMDGVEAFLDGLALYTNETVYSEQFGARVYKITRDEQDNRLTHMKITGGSLKVKMPLMGHNEDGTSVWEEKVNQIRVYSGEKFQAVTEIEAGSVCAVTGLTMTRPGQGLGIEEGSVAPLLEPVLSYQILLKEEMDPKLVLPLLRKLEEEEPELHIVWDEMLQEIQVQIMGEVQLEILQELVAERFGLDITFGSGSILYKETIANVVEGVGHFEPLRHYAEVHLLLEPGERGSGLQFELACSEDELDKNWQRLVLTHLLEKEHRGVLTGSVITDMKISLIAGRAHKKHTEGGDFREATYRAVRQGLKEAQSVLLEPYYEFRLELPDAMIGRAMTDVERMHGMCKISEAQDGVTILTGVAPVTTMKNYQKEVIGYTKGHGRLFCRLAGYAPCHNTEEVITQYGYDSERDLSNPTGSVFCAHGAGFLVEWDRVKEYMHIESCVKENKPIAAEYRQVAKQKEVEEAWIGTEEVDRILERTFFANRSEKKSWKKTKSTQKNTLPTPKAFVISEKREEYLLVDGYNIIFAWKELQALAKENIESARTKLMDVLCNYQAIKKSKVILVFDAYRVQGHQTELFDYHNIHVVYTKEKETADQYIEKFVHQHSKNYHVTVATSDGLEQIIIRGEGADLLSARDLQEEITRVGEQALKKYEQKQGSGRSFLFDALPKDVEAQIKAFGTKDTKK